MVTVRSGQNVDRMRNALLWSAATLASVCTTAFAINEPGAGRPGARAEVPSVVVDAGKLPGVVQVPHKLDEVVVRIVEASPVDHRMFRAIGGSGFHQVGGSDSPNVSFRSDPMLTADGYAIEYLEYRVPAGSDRSITFVLLQMGEGGCYPVGPLQNKYGFARFITPPNPHAADLPPPDPTYVTYLHGNELMLWTSREGGCLRGLRRSGS